MFISIQGKQLFFTAGSASLGFCEEKNRSIAEPGSLKDIVQHPWHKSQFLRSFLCLQITNYCGTCHSPSAGLSGNTKKQNGTEKKKEKKKAKKEVLHWRQCKMLHGLAICGSGVHTGAPAAKESSVLRYGLGLLQSGSPQTWSSMGVQSLTLNVTSTPCWGKEILRVSLKTLSAVTGAQPGTSHILLLCLINMGNGANSLL